MSKSIISSSELSVHSISQFNAIKNRIYAVTDCSSFSELAEYLGVSPARLSDARRRLAFPDAWLQAVALKTQTDFQWLLLGDPERDSS